MHRQHRGRILHSQCRDQGFESNHWHRERENMAKRWHLYLTLLGDDPQPVPSMELVFQPGVVPEENLLVPGMLKIFQKNPVPSTGLRLINLFLHLFSLENKAERSFKDFNSITYCILSSIVHTFLHWKWCRNIPSTLYMEGSWERV